MTEQTDAANLAATNNTGNANPSGAAPAAKPAVDPNAGKTLDNAAGTMKPPATQTADAAKASQSTSRANLNDGKASPLRDALAAHQAPATGRINPATGRPFNDPGPQSQAGSAKVNAGLSTDAGKIAQHEQVDKAKAKLNDANQEGHDKNMEAVQKAHEAGAERQEKAGAPPTGKQRDENTPHIDAAGNKTWKYPQ
jgi:hypothetical protein